MIVTQNRFSNPQRIPKQQNNINFGSGLELIITGVVIGTGIISGLKIGSQSEQRDTITIQHRDSLNTIKPKNLDSLSKTTDNLSKVVAKTR